MTGTQRAGNDCSWSGCACSCAVLKQVVFSCSHCACWNNAVDFLIDLGYMQGRPLLNAAVFMIVSLQEDKLALLSVCSVRNVHSAIAQQECSARHDLVYWCSQL
eukprot:GHRQ01017352.1.p3 GENE.GHRQ01017352.1~~GHRQ01017352.1.p3  ORF type:complete len:104 (-),score=3.24 GHRQ01017352.1:718-1029(-)